MDHANELAPVRESLATGTPIRWTRVHDLPDFVYVDHSIHVQRGVACERCQGPVTNMVRIYQARPLAMGWCLDCHRHSCWDSLGAPAQVFEFRRQDARVPEDVGRRRAAAYEIEPGNLDSCYICHR